MNSCVINRISQFYFRFQLISNKIPQGKHLAGTSSHCTVSLVRLNQGIPQTIPTNSYFPTGNPFVFGVPHQIQFCCGHSMEKAGIPAGFAGVRDSFFRVSVPFPVSSQHTEVNFGCGGIEQRESRGSGCRHYGMEAKAPCHGSAPGMRRGTDGTPGNKSPPSVGRCQLQLCPINQTLSLEKRFPRPFPGSLGKES